MCERTLLDRHIATDLLTSETHCFGIFKPDAISLSITSDIERSIGDLGLRMFNLRSILLTSDDVLAVWPVITTPHASRTVPYMTSAPVELFITQGDEASEKMLSVKRYFRQTYPDSNPVVSVMHTTDHDEELVRCVNYFFGDNENV